MNPKITLHELKTWPLFFQPIADGEKTFEVRKNDRGFEVGDRLLLREWLPNHKEYTGRFMFADVTYILSSFSGVHPDYVVMSIRPIADDNGRVVLGD